VSIGDLAYNTVTGTLFGITSNAQSSTWGGDIYTIDTGTGLATFVSTTIWDTNAGIAFDTSGTFYALGYAPAVGPAGTNMLFTLDTTTGAKLSRVTVDLNDFIFVGLIVNPETDEIFTGERFTGSVIPSMPARAPWISWACRRGPSCPTSPFACQSREPLRCWPLVS